MDHGQASLVGKLRSFTWAKINILKIINLFNIKCFGTFNRNPCKSKTFFFICSNLHLEHARSAFFLFPSDIASMQIWEGITQTFFKWALRPMAPEIEPSYKEETVHETLSTGKGLKKVQDYFLVQSSWSEPRTCFLSSVTFRSPYSFKLAN